MRNLRIFRVKINGEYCFDSLYEFGHFQGDLIRVFEKYGLEPKIDYITDSLNLGDMKEDK